MRKYIPRSFWSKISNGILECYLAKDEQDSDLLRQKNRDIDIIVHKYSEKVFDQVKERLNDRGNEAVEKMSPWIINTLIDFDDFDNIIMDPDVDHDESTVMSMEHQSNSTDHQEHHSSLESDDINPEHHEQPDGL